MGMVFRRVLARTVGVLVFVFVSIIPPLSFLADISWKFGVLTVSAYISRGAVWLKANRHPSADYLRNPTGILLSA